MTLADSRFAVKISITAKYIRQCKTKPQIYFLLLISQPFWSKKSLTNKANNKRQRSIIYLLYQ